MKQAAKRIIGRRDKVDLPLLALYDIDAKIDTGAYTSAIHCHNIEVSQGAGSMKLVKFNLLDPSHPAYNEREFILPVYAQRRVKNSFGQHEERIIIKTDILIFGMTFDAEFSLTDRSEMRYPLLLGRKLIQNRFVVDVALYNLSFKEKLKRKIAR